MKFIRTYTNFSLIKEMVTDESEIEDWFSKKYYTQSRRGNTLFGLEKKDMVTKWGIVKDFEENLSKQDFNSILDLQEFLWNKMNTVIDKENDLRIIDKLNDYRKENNKKEITKERFCDGFYGTQTDMVLGFVATLLKDELELTKKQEAAAKKSADPLIITTSTTTETSEKPTTTETPKKEEPITTETSEKPTTSEETKKVESKPSSPVSEKIKKIIYDIEEKFSYCDNGVVKGRTNFNDVDPFIVQYIEDTIGLESWNKMSERLKAQIYGFCFQSDSNTNNSGNYKLRWISSLYYVLDQTYLRTEIRDCILKPKETPSDEKLKFAINIIKKACENDTINTDELLKNYIELILFQYLILAKNNDHLMDDYIPIWKPRPESIDKAVNGKDMNTILADWQKFIDKYEHKPGANHNDSVDWVLKTDDKNTSTNPNADELFSKIKTSNEFKDLTKVYRWAKGELTGGKRKGVSQFMDDQVKPKIIEGYEKNVNGLEQYLTDYKSGKLTKKELFDDLEDKIKEAENTNTFGHDKAGEFRQAAIALLQKMKTEILPKLN